MKQTETIQTTPTTNTLQESTVNSAPVRKRNRRRRLPAW